MLPLLSDSLTDDNENFGKKSLVVVTNVIVEWIEQERRPAFLLVFKGAEGQSKFRGFRGFKVFSGSAKSNKFVLLLDKTGCASEKLK